MKPRKIKRRLSDLRLAVIGYKHGSPPDSLRLKQLAYEQAWAEENDDQALAAILDEVRKHPKAAREALERLAMNTSCYEADRAFRLLDAGIHNLPVQPIRSECVELFEQEAKLGRMPLREAFVEVASRAPELERITRQFEESYTALMASKDERTESQSNNAAFIIQRDAQQEVDQIIGTQSQNPDPLLRSYLPRNIALSWLDVISRGPPHFDPDASYFSALSNTSRS